MELTATARESRDSRASAYFDFDLYVHKIRVPSPYGFTHTLTLLSGSGLTQGWCDALPADVATKVEAQRAEEPHHAAQEGGAALHHAHHVQADLHPQVGSGAWRRSVCEYFGLNAQGSSAPWTPP